MNRSGMKRTSTPTGRAIAFALAFLAMMSASASAQVSLRPSLGLQTFSFLGDPPAAQLMAPVADRSAPLGGGFEGAQPGIRFQLEIAGREDGILRFPLSVEYFSFDGKTTFAANTRRSDRPQRITFTHTGNILTANLGVTAAFFDKQKIYVSGEIKGVYFTETDLASRLYYGDTDETIRETSGTPFDGAFRLGGLFRVGAQLPFFDPFLLDFSAGIGVANLMLKETDPAEQRNIFTLENNRRDPEQTLQYFTIGMTLLWKL